jgi:hypothetical protein
MTKNNKYEGGRVSLRDCIQRETWCMGPYAGVDYNLIPYVNSNTCTLGNRQPYVRVNFIPQ